MLVNTWVGVTVLWLGAMASVIWMIVDRWAKQDRTGQTFGKSKLGIMLISEYTGQPVGAGNAFVRDLAHFVDGIACCIGFLAPLWEPKRQTWADRICTTVVVSAPAWPGGAAPYAAPAAYGQPMYAPPAGAVPQPEYPAQRPPGQPGQW